MKPKREKLFSLTEAADILNVNDQHLRKLCRTFKVAHTRQHGSGHYFFTQAEIDAFFVHVEPKPAHKK